MLTHPPTLALNIVGCLESVLINGHQLVWVPMEKISYMFQVCVIFVTMSGLGLGTVSND